MAHACIAVLPHPLPSSRGETGEKDDDDGEVARRRRRRRGCRPRGVREQETEEEEDAGGRVVDVAGAKVMGISF